MRPEDYLGSVVGAALGLPAQAVTAEPESTAISRTTSPLWQSRLLEALTGGEDLDARSAYPRGRVMQVPSAVTDLHEDLACLGAPPFGSKGGIAKPVVTKARWPEDRPFALLLSHDIDQIHDRELWRVLADINHIRRVVTQGEPGNVVLAARRVARALFRPKPATKDFDTILGIEGRHGFRSTFFVLHDRYWARQGARFSIYDPKIGAIVSRAKAAGCEVAVHGGYYRFNNAALYRQSREDIGRVFGGRPVGIRNHLLRFTYPETWRAHAEAGFQYDATYGYKSRPGPRSGLALPFFAYDRERQEQLDLVVLPLTVMDTTIYRYLRLQGEAALEFTWSLVERYAKYGGLVTLLWHGNFFNEPEYWDWQMVYEELLDRLAALKSWCAPGAEISAWWRARSAVQCGRAERVPGGWQWNVDVPQEICGLVLLLRPAEAVARITVEGAAAWIEGQADRWCVCFGRLESGTRVRLTAMASS